MQPTLRDRPCILRVCASRIRLRYCWESHWAGFPSTEHSKNVEVKAVTVPYCTSFGASYLTFVSCAMACSPLRLSLSSACLRSIQAPASESRCSLGGLACATGYYSALCALESNEVVNFCPFCSRCISKRLSPNPLSQRETGAHSRWARVREKSEFNCGRPEAAVTRFGIVRLC